MTEPTITCPQCQYENKLTESLAAPLKTKIVVTVSQARPKDIDPFDPNGGVWVVHPRAILPVTLSLRHTLIQVAAAYQATIDIYGDLQGIAGRTSQEVEGIALPSLEAPDEVIQS